MSTNEFPHCACAMQLDSCNLDNPNCPRFHDATWYELPYGLLDPWEPVSLKDLIDAEERYPTEAEAILMEEGVKEVLVPLTPDQKRWLKELQEKRGENHD